MEGVLPRTPLVARGPHVVLRLPKDLAGLANERLTGRMKQISKLSNLEARIEIA
jgi:exopolyphosphatase/guanosine-5'-triphosphate,3'-diphosphate pyrophosphatase